MIQLDGFSFGVPGSLFRSDSFLCLTFVKKKKIERSVVFIIPPILNHRLPK